MDWDGGRLNPAGYHYTTGCAHTVADLTPRHREVAALVAEGMSNHDIADELFIAETTVKQHLTAIYEALGLPMRSGGSNRVMLAKWLWDQQ